jgi:hypothetical protein
MAFGVETAQPARSDLVFLVSYPRSGHHWLVELATEYSSLLYGVEPDVMRKREKTAFVRAGEFSYCEYYRHCGEVPCRDGALVQKNHDLDLGLPLDAAFRYVALARDPVPSIVSYYKLTRAAKPWPAFASRKAKYWCDFVDKWMLTERSNVLRLTYEGILADPAAALSSFLGFCGIPVRADIISRMEMTRLPRPTLDSALDYSTIRAMTDTRYRRLKEACRS